jgi:CDP-glucose 4,6-dehydratase
MRELSGDVRDAPAVRAAFSELRPEVVLHLAGQPIVSRALAEPAETFEINVIGTANVLEAARGTGSVRAVVVATSDKAYADRKGGAPFTEDDPLGGGEPYGASKACAELVAAAYRRSNFRPAGRGVATARAGNVIDGGDWAEDRLVPDLMRGALAGAPGADPAARGGAALAARARAAERLSAAGRAPVG